MRPTTRSCSRSTLPVPAGTVGLVCDGVVRYGGLYVVRFPFIAGLGGPPTRGTSDSSATRLLGGSRCSKPHRVHAGGLHGLFILRAVGLSLLLAHSVACSNSNSIDGGQPQDSSGAQGQDASPPLTCSPKCRPGFHCEQGACISDCNPLCGAGEKCVAGDCVDASTVLIYDYDDEDRAIDFVMGPTSWPNPVLTFGFENTTPDLPAATAQTILGGAMAAWSNACPAIAFVPAPNIGNAAIRFRWATGAHGDNAPFDDGGGPNGNVLAHAYYPTSGAVHFDDFEMWSGTSGTGQINLREVALHELGHALGLAHSNVNSAVMAPFYSGTKTALTQDDIDGIESIYNCGNAGPDAGTSPFDAGISGDAGSGPDGGQTDDFLWSAYYLLLLP